MGSEKLTCFYFSRQAIKSGVLRYRDSDLAQNYGNFGVLDDMLVSRLTGIDPKKIDLIFITFHVNFNLSLTIKNRKLKFTGKVAPESPIRLI